MKLNKTQRHSHPRDMKLYFSKDDIILDHREDRSIEREFEFLYEVLFMQV